MLKGIIFDMDGVLINSEPQHYEAYERMLERFGLTIPYEEYKGFIGSTCAKLNEYLAEKFPIGLTPEQIHEEMMKERDWITENVGYIPVPGACDCVKMLKEQGVKLAVASSSPMEDILAATEQLGIQEYFDELISGSELANPKPAPDVFLKAIESIGLQPEECLIIEDSGNGVRAGKAAGCAVLAFYNPDSGNQDLSPADYVMESFEGLEFEFIKRVHQRFAEEPWTILETKRCIVREITLDDLPELRRIYEQKGITEYLEPLYGEEEEIAYTKAYIEKRYRFFEYGMWVVFDKETGSMIGRAGLENRDVAVRIGDEGQKVYESQVELGYMIAPSYQRQGYATEVCHAILQYAKEELEIPFINAFIHHDNIASIRLAEKMNFTLLEKTEVVDQDSAMVRYICTL